MTEIGWLVQFIMNQELSTEAKAECIKRIGEVEANFRPQPSYPPINPILNNRPVSQAQMMDQGEMEALHVPIINHAPITPGMVPPKVEVNTGRGTRGPRKF